jgi:hypothetical protein
MEEDRMKAAQLAKLRHRSLLFLLPGLAGLILSALLSTYFLEDLPRWPMPEEGRMTPKDINGNLVYETVAEDWTLSLMEDSAVVMFVIGLGMGLVYLEQWGRARVQGIEEEDEVPEGAVEEFPEMAVWTRNERLLEDESTLEPTVF